MKTTMKFLSPVLLTGMMIFQSASASSYQEALNAYNQGKTDQALRLALL